MRCGRAIVPTSLVLACMACGGQDAADVGASPDGGSCNGDATACADGADGHPEGRPDAGGPGDASAPLDATGPDASGSPAQATTFLANPGHTSSTAGVGVTPPLRRAWTVTLPGAVSYPLVAGGRVFVTTNATASTSTHAQLLALDAATGHAAWSVDLGTTPAATAAYDDGRVFLMAAQGAPATLRAFDAATGTPGWTANPENQSYFDAPPVAYRGIVYLHGTGEGGTLYAYDESTGKLLWTATDSGGEGAPAVSDDGVFLSGGCVTAFHRTTGAKVWQSPGSCEQTVEMTAVVSGTTVYAVDSKVAVNAQTGAVVGSFTGDLPPAFDGAFGFVVASGALVAATGGLTSVAWTFQGDGRLSTVPFVAGGAVYVGSSEGNFYAVDEASGTPLWSDNVGYPLATQERFTQEPRVAIAGAGAVVLVPAGSTLVAYESGGSPDAGTDGAGGDGGCHYTLTLKPPVFTGSFPQSVVIDDLNGDGHLDFAVVDQGLGSPPNGTVTAIPGHGDGTFGADGPASVVGIGCSGVVGGDFNGDGKSDLAIANTDGDSSHLASVGVLLGKGDGTFLPQVTYATERYPGGVATGDFDRNGTLDLAVAVASGGLDVLLGKGDGTFAPEASYPGKGSYAVAVGDIDGNGVLDAVVANTYDLSVGVLRGNGDGTFQPETTVAIGTDPPSIALGDVDGDGHLDVAVTNYQYGTVGVLYGHGDGTFEPPITYPVGLNPIRVVIVDLNRDGRADLAVTNFGAATVSVLLNTGTRQFAPQFVLGTGAGPSAIATADLNADGWPDLAAVDSDDNTVAVFLGGCTGP